MKLNNSPRGLALSILKDFGIDEPHKIDIEDIVYALEIPIQFKSLTGCDGRIIHGKKNSIITINRDIEFETRKRFTIAHELGHYLMHKDNPIQHTDTISSLSWFNNKGNTGISLHEFEANTFASELLLPTHKFMEAIQGIPFSPGLIRKVSDQYHVSRSSIIYRFVEYGNHPVCVFYSQNNKVHFWRKSEGFYYKIKDITKLAPPNDSVAAEYFTNQTIYSIEDSKQEIVKSTWLDVNGDFVNDCFYEFCLVYSAANLAISVIWED